MYETYAVTWGLGGPGCTVAGLERREAHEVSEMYRAWGPVTMVYGPGRPVCYAGTGVPVAEENATAAYLRSLS